MSDSNENQLKLRMTGHNPFGATFWSLKIDTRFDGRAQGGLLLEFDINTQIEGLRIAGELIPWDVLMKAKEYAESKQTKSE